MSTLPLPDPPVTELALTHLNLDVADLDVSERFYREEFGLPVARRSDSLAVRLTNFLLVLAAGTPHVGGSFHFGFQVPTTADVDAWFVRFRSRDVPIVEAPLQRGTVYVGRVTDPDGYPIEIYCEL